jgi:molybdopterin converting factor small subunit
MPTVKLFANLRKIAERKELPVPGTNLRCVLNKLVKEVPALDGVILEDDLIRPHFIITINGQNTTELDVSVAEQDIIAIFSPIAGG